MAVNEVPRDLENKQAVRIFLETIVAEDKRVVKKATIDKLSLSASTTEIILKINEIIDNLS